MLPLPVRRDVHNLRCQYDRHRLKMRYFHKNISFVYSHSPAVNSINNSLSLECRQRAKDESLGK